MSADANDATGGWVADGYLNRVVGWTMLVAGLALAAALDPWFFSIDSVSEYSNSLRPAVRHAQGVVLGMALLQLAMAHLLATRSFSRAVQQSAAWLTAVGAGIYAAGYGFGLQWPAWHALVLIGSLMNLGGFAMLLCLRPTGKYAGRIRLMLPVACFGMLLDFTAGLLLFFPESFILEHLGPDDGVRLRMLRLARVAAIALSVLTLLYQGAVGGNSDRSATLKWAGVSLMLGAIGMPAILAAACFTSLQLKYLLSIPATLVLVGVYVGLGEALRRAGLLERWGWLLVAASITSGMLMGLYAFDGPLPTPELLGPYDELARRLSRIAHSYCIVLGIVAIFLSRETAAMQSQSLRQLLAVANGFFIAGSVVTIGALLARIGMSLPADFFSVGPALVVLATAACLAQCVVVGRVEPASRR